MKENSKVVIITINYDQHEMTLDCLKSIQKLKFNNFEIVLVDNGSTQENYDFLKSKISEEVNVVRLKTNVGYVQGVNSGIEKGMLMGADYFLIMNNDTIIDSMALNHLLESSIEFGPKVIVSGKVYHFDDPNRIQYAGSFFSNRKILLEEYPGKDEIDDGRLDRVEERDMLDDIFWLFPSKLIDDIGFYSENFFLYCEQADFALRAVKNGYRLFFNPFAKLWHKGSLTTGGGNRFAPAVNYWRKKSSVIFLFRNIRITDFILIHIKRLGFSIIKNGMNYLGLRHTEDSRSDYAGLIGYLHGLGWVFNQKPDDGKNPFK